MSSAMQISLAVGLLGLGWAVGYTQRPVPEFMLSIDAPAGETRIECASGCQLLGARDLGNAAAGRMKTYVYSCSGANVDRCKAQAAGWLIR